MPLFGPPAVAKLKAKGDVSGLIKALAYEKERDREAALEALVGIGVPAVKPLLAALDGVDRHAGWYAAKALGHIGNPAAVGPLIDTTHDPLVSMRQVAVSALVEIGAPALKALIAALPSWPAAEALGRIGDKRAVAPLIAILPNWAALVALGRIGDARALEPLLATLEGLDLTDREAAARALGRIGDARAVEPLKIALSRADQTKEFREAATEAIAALSAGSNPPAGEPLARPKD